MRQAESYCAQTLKSQVPDRALLVLSVSCSFPYINYVVRRLKKKNKKKGTHTHTQTHTQNDPSLTLWDKEFSHQK